MKIIIYCISSLLFVMPVYAATSNVSTIQFTTEARSTDIGITSDVITIQTQNGDGTEEKLDSTADVTFISSSATGEFLGGTGKAVTKTMNSGSANKSFYYRDSTSGAHTITIRVIPRNGGGEWVAEQKVFVGVAPEIDTTEFNNDEEESTNTIDSNNDNGAQSSAKKLSTVTKKHTMSIGAGRPRTTLVNTPIQFEVESLSKLSSDTKYRWSFGDGDSDVGKKVQHVYYFPGEYNVVLTAHYNGDKISSRTKVKVIGNRVSIIDAIPGIKGYVEIKNESSSEINLEGWEIHSGHRSFLVSTDTIVAPYGIVRIPNQVMNFEPEDIVELIFPTDEMAFRFSKSQHILGQHMQQVAVVTIPPMVPSMVKEEAIEEIKKPNYATTVAATVVLPQPNWWSYLKSFFSVE